MGFEIGIGRGIIWAGKIGFKGSVWLKNKAAVLGEGIDHLHEASFVSRFFLNGLIQLMPVKTLKSNYYFLFLQAEKCSRIM